MKAPQKARQAHARKQSDNTLTQGVVVPFRTAAEKAQKFLGWKQQTQANKDKQRLARARIAAEALPVSGGYSQRHEDPGQPTPERAAKNTRSPLQPYSGKWPPHVEIAFARFLIESQVLAQHGQRVTINYGASGGGSDPSRRNGGLPDKIRHVASRMRFVRYYLDPDSLYILDKLVLEMPSEATGAVATLAEIGRWLFPHIRDVRSSNCVSLGALVTIGKQLDSLYAEYDRDFGGR